MAGTLKLLTEEQEAEKLTQERDESLEAIGITKNPDTGQYYYGGSVDENGNVTGVTYPVSQKEAIDLADKVKKIEANSKGVFSGNIEGLLGMAGYTTDNDANYRDKDGNIIPPQKLLVLAEQQRTNMVLDHGRNAVYNDQVQANLPVLDTAYEEKLYDHKSNREYKEQLVLSAAKAAVANVIITHAQSQQPTAAGDETMEMALPLHDIKTCKTVFDPEKPVKEQHSEECTTVGQLGLMSSPNTIGGIGFNLTFGR